MDVVKATGQKEPYSTEKLCSSMKSAGAPEVLAKNVCGLIERKLSPGVSTSEIFRRAFRYLVKEDIRLGARYSLRRAVAGLGPAGFLFEQYVEAILQSHGYQTKRGVFVQGHCVEHEIDIMATKGKHHHLVEVKYKNVSGLKTHIDVVMYADARLIDIAQKHDDEGEDLDHAMWVVTNTKFSSKAIQYGKCRRMKLVGWNYPSRGGLEELIISKKVYPITVLPSVSRFEREQFAEKGMILAQDILPYSPSDLMHKLGIPPQIAEKIVSEAQGLLKEN
jgi:Holliday junction resolvase-like predicted endonuclease